MTDPSTSLVASPPFARPLRFAALALALAAGAAACGPPAASPEEGAVFERKLAAIAAEAQGQVSVTVLNLRTGQRVALGGQTPRPMMSVYKLPLAVLALAEIDHGTWRVDQQVPVAESELRGKGPIADAWRHGEKDPSLQHLLEAMLVDSDNTAGDKVEALLTHRPGVAARLHDMGIEGITITGPEIARDAALACPGALTPDGGWTPYEIEQCPKPTPEAAAAAARKEAEAPPDNATTDALVELLARLRDGSILTGDSRAWLLGKLVDVHTGAARLKAGLPAGARLAHKTGTGATVQGVTVAMGDVGIVTAPNDDAFAIAVLIAGAHAPVETQEAVIAKMARAAWEFVIGR